MAKDECSEECFAHHMFDWNPHGDAVTICECEECVAARKWIVEKTGVGGGPKPLSFIISSHEYMAAERRKYEVSLKKQNELVDRLMKERKEQLGTCGTWRHGSIEELPHPQRPTCSNWLPGYAEKK